MLGEQPRIELLEHAKTQLSADLPRDVTRFALEPSS